MSFQPVIPSVGIAGWRFLQRTYDAQIDAFSASPDRQRDSDYFLEKIGTVRSASDLVTDRRLLNVALGAFGLQDDVGNRAFIQKILEDGTGSRDALANRLTDGRYKRLSAAFGFGPDETRTTGDIGKMREIVALQRAAAFEVSVGAQDDTMRIALYAQRELQTLAGSRIGDDAKWFSLMGLPPLRSMLETALGLPTAFGQIDIDKQLEVFRDKVRAVTGDGSVAQFADPAAREKITNLFLTRSQLAASDAGLSASANALALLRVGGF